MERFSEVKRDCFRISAACVDCSRFILWASSLASTCSLITSSRYSKFCWRMALLRGPETLVEARNSTSAAEVGFVRAIPPNLAGRADISFTLSLGMVDQ